MQAREADRTYSYLIGGLTVEMMNFTETYTTDHYIFNYHKNSVAEREIAAIANTQEECFAQITRQLDVSFPMKIEYFLCNSAEEVGMYLEEKTPCYGFADSPNKIYAVYSDEAKCIGAHEDAHIISYQINHPESTFLREGLAMYFDKEWWSIPNEKWSKYYLELGMVPELSDLLEDEYFFTLGCEQSYPIAGCFVSWIIEMYSKDMFLEIYREQGDYAKKLEEKLQKPPQEINRMFQEYIRKADLDEELRVKMSNLLSEG